MCRCRGRYICRHIDIDVGIDIHTGVGTRVCIGVCGEVGTGADVDIQT